MADENLYAHLSDDDLAVVHSTCESFEQSLRLGEPVTIEQFVETAPPQLREPLFREPFGSNAPCAARPRSRMDGCRQRHLARRAGPI